MKLSVSLLESPPMLTIGMHVKRNAVKDTTWVGFSSNDKAESAEKLTCTDLGLGLQMLGLLHCCDCTGLMLSPQGCQPHPQE